MVDVVIFRQNTEGLYGGVEWSNPPQQVYDALMTHPKFRENFGWCPKEELAISTRIFTRKYTERIVRAAFEHASEVRIQVGDRMRKTKCHPRDIRAHVEDSQGDAEERFSVQSSSGIPI